MSDHHHAHAHDHTEPPSDVVLRVQALESLLVEKGLVDPAAIDVLIDTYETKVGPRLVRPQVQAVAVARCDDGYCVDGLYRPSG